MGIYVSGNNVRPERLKEAECSVYIFVLGTVVWICCLSWWDIHIRYVKLLFLREVYPDGLDFRFSDVYLLRYLNGGVGYVLVDEGNKASTLLVLSIRAMC